MGRLHRSLVPIVISCTLVSISMKSARAISSFHWSVSPRAPRSQASPEIAFDAPFPRSGTSHPETGYTYTSSPGQSSALARSHPGHRSELDGDATGKVRKLRCNGMQEVSRPGPEHEIRRSRKPISWRLTVNSNSKSIQRGIHDYPGGIGFD